MSAPPNRKYGIYDAVKKGDTARLEELLRSGVPVDLLDSHGFTPLIWATKAGQSACVKILLEAYADYNHVDKKGSTPLHYAALVGGPASVLLLLKAGADIEAEDTFGHTPLSNAVVGINPSSVDLLLDRGAQFTAKLNEGRRPIWFKIFMVKRENCQNAVSALYKILRKRYRPGGTRIPKDMVRMLASYVRQSRHNTVWQFYSE
jgi:ankyrin repeat protein